MSTNDPLISFWVAGNPATQGSKSPGRGGIGFHESDKKLPAWRKAVEEAGKMVANQLDGVPYDFPLRARLDVFLPAPKRSKFGKYPAGKPDLDKLQRAVGDGLTASGLIKDDSRVVVWRARKHWAVEGTGPGARIQLEDLRDELYVPFTGGDDKPATIFTEATQFSVNRHMFGAGPMKVRAMIPTESGQLQEVEIHLPGSMVEKVHQHLGGGFSIQLPAPSSLTPEAHAKLSAEAEIERRYGKGGL